MGKETVHYEAPPSLRVADEMERFLRWFNDTTPGQPQAIKQSPVRCAIAHLYFESIHPFEDGNGRVGRAIAEKALSQGLGRPVLLSLSRTIERNKNDYYDALEAAQRSLEITPWINYFAGVILDAQKYAEQQIDFTLKKTLFFDKFHDQLGERQLKAVLRVMEAGPTGFKGGLNAAKYGSMNRVSKATATRDLQELLAKGVLILSEAGGGRNTSYELNFEGRSVKSSKEDPLSEKIRAAIETIDKPEVTDEDIGDIKLNLNSDKERNSYNRKR
jgi:Fic family protein